MEKLLVMDVAKVTLRDKSTGKITATATASATGLNATLNEELIRAGWGGGVVATINSEKNVELTMSDVFFSMDYLAMAQGTEVEENATGEVLDSFVGTVVDSTGTLSITVPAEVTALEGILVDLDGSQDAVTITSGKITVPTGSEAKKGDEVTVFYKKAITGQKVVIDSQKFPKYVEVLYHTRAFNPDTNEVTKDIYIQFDKVKPSGNFNFDLAVSSAVNTEITMTAMNQSQNSTEMGRYFAVDRVNK